MVKENYKKLFNTREAGDRLNFYSHIDSVTQASCLRTLAGSLCYSFGLDVIVLTPSELENEIKTENDFFIDILSSGKILYEQRRN